MFASKVLPEVPSAAANEAPPMYNSHGKSARTPITCETINQTTDSFLTSIQLIPFNTRASKSLHINADIFERFIARPVARANQNTVSSSGYSIQIGFRFCHITKKPGLSQFN
jgi:hypothetical protein